MAADTWPSHHPALAVILPSLFNEYDYNPGIDSDTGEPLEDPTFEIGLDTLIEALNVFGSGGGNIPVPSEKNSKRGWKDKKDDGDNDDDDGRGSARPERARTPWTRGNEKVTMMKLTYGGKGDAVRLIL